MKKKLNLLCILIFCVLGLTLAESFYAVIWGVKEGVKAGIESNLKKTSVLPDNLSALYIYPKGLTETHDSIFNAKSGQFIPAWRSTSIVDIKTDIPVWLKFVRIILSLLMIIYGIKAVIFFIKLIKAINQSEIFSWKNVKLLRKLGTSLLIVFIGNFIFSMIDTLALQKVLTIPGYSYNYLHFFADSTLLLGVISFIIAEIFAIGLKMKEEQDLTI